MFAACHGCDDIGKRGNCLRRTAVVGAAEAQLAAAVVPRGPHAAVRGGDSAMLAACRYGDDVFHVRHPYRCTPVNLAAITELSRAVGAPGPNRSVIFDRNRVVAAG